MQAENEVEVWKDVVGYVGLYKVSNLGKVKRLSRSSVDCLGRPYTLKEAILKPNKIKGNYYQLKLTNNYIETSILLHRLVCEAFHGPAPAGKNFVNHKIGDKSNNRADNLEWCSFQENVDHAVLNGLRCRGSSSHKHKLVEEQILEICRLRDTEGLSRYELAAKFNISHRNICNILSGDSWNWLTNRKQ